MKKDELREEIAMMRVEENGGGSDGNKKLLPDYLHVRNMLQGKLNRSLTSREKSMVAEILEETQVGEQRSGNKTANADAMCLNWDVAVASSGQELPLEQCGGGNYSKLDSCSQNKNKDHQYRWPITMMLGKLRLNLDIEKRARSLFAKSSKGSQQKSFNKEQNQHPMQPHVAGEDEDEILEAWDDTYSRAYFFNRRTRKSGWAIGDVK